MSNPPALSSIADWLHAGYPDGIPDDDYAALLALLAPRHLSDDEVTNIAGQLKRSNQRPLAQQPVAPSVTHHATD